MHFVDRSVIAGTKIRESDGALLCDARIARTGIQYYLGSEVDPDNEHGLRDKAYVAVYRPGSEVFSKDTMASAAHRPVTNDHPKEMVSADNWKDVSVGNTTDEVVGESIYLRVPLIISDGATIKQIEDGKRELSSGYWSDMDWNSGKTPSGEHYDCSQKNIRINHVAVVKRGRAGKSVRIGDEAAVGDVDVPEDYGENKGDHTMADTRKVTVDGIAYDANEQTAQVIERLQGQVKTLTTDAATAATTHKIEVDGLNAELAAKDAEIDGLKTKILDAASLDKLVAARAQLLSDARIVHKDVKTEGLDVAAIKRSAVTLVLGDDAVKDKPDAYIDARFDILLEEAKKAGKKDPFADGRSTQTPADNNPNKASYDAMIQELYGAPKTTAAAA